jgi:type IV secretory pathway TrbF-like protein
MTATRRPRLEDMGVEYTMRRRALHQAEPMRQHAVVGHNVYLEPRATWWWRMGVLAVQALAWVTLVLMGLLCLMATLLFLWGVTQAFALLIRALMGVR